MIARVLILISLAGVPPLTPEQRAELVVEGPTEQLEGPGLRPLLENVLTWDTADAAFPDLPTPDYDTLLADPSAGLGGEAYLIEGKFAGRARRFMLERSGPWGDALTEWVLIVRDEPQQVAVVYFVDPDNQLRPPRSGAKVRVPARFHKVWADTDQQGQPTDYLTFLARAPLTSTTAETNQLGTAMPLLLGVLLLALIYVGVLRLSRSTRRPAPVAPVTAKSGGDAMLSDLPEQALPDDPAEALQRLADRRHDS